MLTKKYLRVALPSLLALLTLGLFTLPKTRGANGATTKLVTQMPETDGPEEAMRWRHLAWLDENGEIAPGALARAMTQKRAMIASHRSFASGWQEVGPANLSGRSTCLAIDPNHPLTMWMGSAGGGIWKSTDGGSTWNPLGDQLKSLAVNALVLDPNDKSTLYAGTGEGYFNIDAIGGFGMFKSTDGGVTWTVLPGTSGWSSVNRIAIQPGDSNVILVSVKYGGYYRSTDSGASWKKVLAVQSGHALAFCNSNPQRVIGTIQDYNFTTKTWFASAVLSTDAGATWTKATGPLNTLNGFSRIETAPVPNDETTVYASASDGLVYKSTDSGASYSEVTVTGNTGANWYGNAIWVDPTNSKRVVVGGVNIYASTDGGVTMNIIGQGYIQTSEPHPDVHFFIQSPGYDGITNKVVYVCTDGGLYQATDISTASVNSGWLRRDQGARTTQYYSVAGDGPSGRIVGGLQDNGTQSNLAGSNQSQYIYGGDGGYVAIDSQFPQYVYGEYIYLEMFRNNDGGSGSNVGSIYSGLSDAGSGSTANFIAPFILDPNNPQILLAGGASLWRTTNARASSPSWGAIRAPSTSLISAIAVAPRNSDIIWVGQNDGTLAMTTNGTATTPTWKVISTGGTPTPNRYVTRILVDPDNSNVVYVTLGGFSTNNVWKTTNGGATWSSITGTGTGTLPQVPVRAIVRDLYSANSLMVGTEIGVFSTTDGGQSWSVSNDMPTNVSVDELVYMNNSTTLLAGTHGRGVWMLPGAVFTVSNLSASPTSVPGGSNSTGTVTISPAAPSLGMTVHLISTSADVTLPSTVVVPGGATSANFTIKTAGVKSIETVTIQATLGSTQQSTSLTVSPASLGPVTLNPVSVVGGNPSMGTITLAGSAPPNGAVVYLSSDSSIASVPASITIPYGSTSGTFQVNTLGVTAPKTAKITAVFGNAAQSANLSVTAASLQSVNLSALSVVGGSQDALTGTVVLNGNAGANLTVILNSANTKVATVPATLKIPTGASSVSFSVTHLKVSVSTKDTIKAYLSGSSSSVSTTITANPFTISQMSVNPTTVQGGTSTGGLISLNAKPGTKSGPISITFASPSKLVKLPTSVSVPIGNSTATFSIGTYAVSGDSSATVTGSVGSSSQQVLVSILAPQLSNFTISPTSVKGGSTTAVFGTLTISSIAPSRGAIIEVTSSDKTLATVPGVVIVPAGQTQVKFKVTHKTVTKQSTVNLTATYQNQSKQAQLTLSPG